MSQPAPASTKNTAATSNDCDRMLELFRPLLEGELSQQEQQSVSQHIARCKFCAAEFEQEKNVVAMLSEAFNGTRISEDFDEKADRRVLELSRRPQTAATGVAAGLPGVAMGGGASGELGGEAFMAALEGTAPESNAFVARMGEAFSGAPWWIVSVVLHVLVVALAGLISMAVEMPKGEDVVVMVTELSARPPIAVVEEKKIDERDILASKHETPPTDPTSKDFSKVVVPKDILDRASLSDHFETINPDRPDTHDALGNADAEMFHSTRGSADEPGGGGNEGASLADVVGVGGASSAGSGGGWGGGAGGGHGNGSGRGGGSFGQRTGGGRNALVKRHGGSKATEGAVDKGLEWLARNQEVDGHWDALKHGAKAGQWTTCQETLDVSCTGLAVLSFLGAGHTEKVGKYKENVIKGLKWLKQRQNYETGAFAQYNYAHAIAAMAMAEGAGMAKIADTVESAQKAIDLTTAKTKKYDTSDRGGWNYIPPQLAVVGGGDMSNSGWAMMAIKSAKVAGLKIPFESIEGVNRYLTSCQRDKVKGGAYPEHKYSYGSDAVYKDQDNRGYIAILGRLFFGTPPNEVEEGVKYMIEKRGGEKGGGLPHSGLVADGAWRDGANVDMYYTYYMTLITFQVGGELWQKWNEKLKVMVPKIQCIGGANDGSWDPRGAYSEDWGRVGQTALSILSMEVYYRYQKLSEH